MRFIPPPSEEAVCYTGKLPAEYCALQLPSAEVLRTTGNFGTVISQQVKGNDYSIWKHDFFISKTVLLYPYVPEGVYTINYMLKGNIPCELVDFGKVELQENTYNLYYVPPVKQYAWLEAGHFSCMHIDLSPVYLQELATEFKPLREFLDSAIKGNAKVVRATNYSIDGNIRMILKDIIGFKGIGAPRNMYMRSRIYDLLVVFSRDLLREDHPVFRVDHVMLEEIRTFIAENYHLPITNDDLCRRFGISESALSRKFKALFSITVHKYLTQQRMEACVRLLDQHEPVHKIAIAVGYSDTFSFTKAFTAFYNCSPTNYMNRR